MRKYFTWIATHEEAFQAIKQALIAAHVLGLPDYIKKFQLGTYASDCGVGAVLMQQGHPLAFISEALGPRTKGLSTYENEYLAILIVVDQWRSYLLLAEFLIVTDEKGLTHLDDQRLHTYWHHKIFTKLLGLQYRIVYRKESENRVADALSRHSAPPDQLMAISTCTPSWLATVKQGYNTDPKS
jgi:hypothetical protein